MSRGCDKVHADLYGYLDGEITVYRRTRVWWHLRRCPPCADGFHFEIKLKDRIRSGCVEDPPEELYERLRAFLKRDGAGEVGG